MNTDLKRARRKPLEAPSRVDRLPPYSLEAEQGVLGCIMFDPFPSLTELFHRYSDVQQYFYDARHQIIFSEMVLMFNAKAAIDTITLQQRLRDKQQLEGIGGLAYLASLVDAVPSAANIHYYAEILRDKFVLRRMISSCNEIVESAYEYEGEVNTLVDVSRAKFLASLNHQDASVTEEHWTLQELQGYDTTRDPNAIIGMTADGQASRYLCRGYGCWIIAQSGIGKSTYSIQQALAWTLGKPFFGTVPYKKGLRTLIIQNENDKGDVAENVQGIIDHSGFTPEEFDQLNVSLKVIRCRGKTGQTFCRWMEREVTQFKADLVYVDPLLRFAGIDVSRQEQCTKFLNDYLDPVLANTGVVMTGIHHTGKPKNQKETQNWTVFDYAYAGIGSSELVNWARAITIMRALPSMQFEALLAKRGPRAWATHPNGEKTTSIFLQHSLQGIFWEQIDPPGVERVKNPAAGRKSAVDEIAFSNVHEFLTGCLPEGEQMSEIAQRLERWLAKTKRDLSYRSCQRVVAAMVANGKLTKGDNLMYFKGPNA